MLSRKTVQKVSSEFVATACFFLFQLCNKNFAVGEKNRVRVCRGEFVLSRKAVRKASSGFLATARIFLFSLAGKFSRSLKNLVQKIFQIFVWRTKIRFGFWSEFFGFRKIRARGCRGVPLPKCRFVKLRLTKWLLSIAKLFVARQLFKARF